MENLISVIIPVYNVARYLPECLDSVLSQDHRELEVILIDDGSTDASGEICDAYAAKDSRVTVIHQKNGGAAAAKNAGLRIATGKYLSFVDSDDYLEPNVYGYMVRTLEENGADAVQFSFQNVYTDRVEEELLKPEVLNSQEYLVRFTKDWTCALLWNKLYKRCLYEGILFEEGHKIDDEYFTYQGFLKPRKILRDSRIIYNYRKRGSSVMSSPAAAEQRLRDCLDSTVKRREKVVAVYPQLRRAFDENYLDVLHYLTDNEGNTEQTLRLLKSHLKGYLRTRGNTFPPRYLWPMLLRLYVTGTEKLLADCEKRRSQLTAAEDHFS